MMGIHGIPFLRPSEPLSAEEAFEAADRAFLRHLRWVKVRHVVLVALLALLGSLGVGAWTGWLTARSSREQAAVEHPGRILSQEKVREFVGGLRSGGAPGR